MAGYEVMLLLCPSMCPSMCPAEYCETFSAQLAVFCCAATFKGGVDYQYHELHQVQATSHNAGMVLRVNCVYVGVDVGPCDCC